MKPFTIRVRLAKDPKALYQVIAWRQSASDWSWHNDQRGAARFSGPPVAGSRVGEEAVTDDARIALIARLEELMEEFSVGAAEHAVDAKLYTQAEGTFREAIAVLSTPAPDLRTMADEMRHELFIVGNHPALGVDRVMVDRWLRRLDAALSFVPCEKCAASPGWGAVSAEYCDVWATMVPVVQRCACWVAWHERRTAARLVS